MDGSGRAGRLLATACALVLGTAAPAAAHLGDTVQAVTGLGVDPIGATMPMALRDEPATLPTPQAPCGPGSLPEPGMQGRVPSGAAAAGLRCNAAEIGRHGRAGGYKVLRHVDRAGRECAYYDTTLLFPLNAATLGEGGSLGVEVLDMSDPAHPRPTATLTTPAMLTPHESLELNARRGLLAAVTGTPAFHAGHIDLYDVGTDCRAPRLLSSLTVGVLGHESGFAPDGRTFYATSIGGGTITAIDVSDPRLPLPLWVGHYNAHGLTVSDDGDRAYVAARQGLMILDVSEIDARVPRPQVRLVGGVSWRSMTIPQVAIPVEIDGRPYIVEVDEFSHDPEDEAGALGTRVARNGERVGAARVIDVANESAPRVVSNLRLEVHQPEHRASLAEDPGAGGALQGYAGHYCNVPRRQDPGIVACSFIASGLRVFDIRDPRHPREVAYSVTEPGSILPGAEEPANWAMSRPAFVPERREIWYSDAGRGLIVVRLAEDVWP